MSGGAFAAARFQFQYLYTISALLDIAESAGDTKRVVTVEGVRTGGSPRTMDFSVRSGDTDEAFVEIKYTSARAATSVVRAIAGMLRMVEFGDASE
ncbi:hypothetical protein [Nocardia sp. CA-120079]|uniref:hypothetical protein n=1 Tax=Nocardia sp. CA-120079 TaxID=3239974 RepID=UPI003D98EDC0